MIRNAFTLLREERDVRVSSRGDFDGVRMFDDILDMMPPTHDVERIILDFSHTSRLSPLELHYLLSELAADPSFSNVEICLEGVKLSRAGHD